MIRVNGLLKIKGYLKNYKINVLQLIYHHASYEGDQKDYEFSKWTMREHWAAGLEDARRTLSHPEWLKMDQSTGMTLHDVHRDE